MSVPSPIQHCSERVLEFDQLRQVLAFYTGSPPGQARVMELTPSRDRQWIECQQQLTEELRGYLRASGHFDFHGLLDPTPLVNKSRIQGAALEITEIRDLLLAIDRAAEWREIALHPRLPFKTSGRLCSSFRKHWKTSHPCCAIFATKSC